MIKSTYTFGAIRYKFGVNEQFLNIYNVDMVIIALRIRKFDFIDTNEMLSSVKFSFEFEQNVCYTFLIVVHKYQFNLNILCILNESINNLNMLTFFMYKSRNLSSCNKMYFWENLIYFKITYLRVNEKSTPKKHIFNFEIHRKIQTSPKPNVIKHTQEKARAFPAHFLQHRSALKFHWWHLTRAEHVRAVTRTHTRQNNATWKYIR